MAASLEYVAERETWNVYHLEDGTVVRLRLILTRIARNGSDPNGNPQYLWDATTLAQVEPATMPVRLPNHTVN